MWLELGSAEQPVGWVSALGMVVCIGLGLGIQLFGLWVSQAW